MATKRISVKELLDNSPATSFQFGLYALCFLVVFFDGFDVALIGATLPKIGQFLHAAPGALGVAVGASMAGPLIGALLFGMLADRFGRKNMLIVSTVIYGVFALITTHTTSIGELALFRFLTGLGLGGAIPNALAYGCEFAPTSKRASFTTLMYAGMPVGSIPVGFLAAWLLPHHGWQILYWVGGIPSLVLAVVLAIYLPESLGFLVRQGGDKAKIGRIAAKISPSVAADPNLELYSTEEKLPGVPVKHLFLEGRAFTTIAIWVLFFLTFYLIYILLAWAPGLLAKSGATVQQASYAFAFIGIGSFLATITIGRLIDRLTATSWWPSVSFSPLFPCRSLEFWPGTRSW
jgi:AAHS family 4-hydroxybenzoate transporter-like MFS transporter